MDTNFNNTSFYVIIFSLIILVGCFYFIYQKIRKINDTIGQLQKHVMYQQGIIEKHNLLLRNTGATINQTDVNMNIPPIQPFENEVKEEKKESSTQEKANPIQTLLPMISSLMGMMNQGEEEEEEEEDVEEKEERKTEMVKEIESELNELKKTETTLPSEGRVEEEET